jgi:hypothetical protein
MNSVEKIEVYQDKHPLLEFRKNLIILIIKITSLCQRVRKKFKKKKKKNI